MSSRAVALFVLVASACAPAPIVPLAPLAPLASSPSPAPSAALAPLPAQPVAPSTEPPVGWGLLGDGLVHRSEPDNLAEPLAKLLATGRVKLEVCARTLEEKHLVLADVLPGAEAVPSGSSRCSAYSSKDFCTSSPDAFFKSFRLVARPR